VNLSILCSAKCMFNSIKFLNKQTVKRILVHDLQYKPDKANIYKYFIEIKRYLLYKYGGWGWGGEVPKISVHMQNYEKDNFSSH